MPLPSHLCPLLRLRLQEVLFSTSSRFSLLKYVVCLRGKLALRDNLHESWGQIAVSWKQYPLTPPNHPPSPKRM